MSICMLLHLQQLKENQSQSSVRPFAFLQTGGISVFKDINILANHLHGFYGSMGTDGYVCDDPLPTDGPCYRGDNIFADIEPGSCAYYQYDFPLVASPGALW